MRNFGQLKKLKPAGKPAFAGKAPAGGEKEAAGDNYCRFNKCNYEKPDAVYRTYDIISTTGGAVSVAVGVATMVSEIVVRPVINRIKKIVKEDVCPDDEWFVKDSPF